MTETKDFWVECNVCKTQLKNHTGSTPCCGSIAWIVEDGVVTRKMSLFASINNEPIIKEIIIDLESDEESDRLSQEDHKASMRNDI